MARRSDRTDSSAAVRGFFPGRASASPSSALQTDSSGNMVRNSASALVGLQLTVSSDASGRGSCAQQNMVSTCCLGYDRGVRSARCIQNDQLRAWPVLICCHLPLLCDHDVLHRASAGGANASSGQLVMWHTSLLANVMNEITHCLSSRRMIDRTSLLVTLPTNGHCKGRGANVTAGNVKALLLRAAVAVSLCCAALFIGNGPAPADSG